MSQTTFDVVATLAYRENYGAHDWDGEGECPQYWKCKGDSEQVILTGLTVEQVSEYGPAGLAELVRANVTETADDYVEYTLRDWELVCFDQDLLSRVRAAKAEEAEDWGENDPYLYMAVAVNLRIPEYAAKRAMELIS